MNETRKKIASLALLTSMLISASGCSKNTIERTVDENNNISYTGEVNLDGIDNIYIVEIETLENERQLYLTKNSPQNFFEAGNREYELLGAKIELTNSCQYKSNYGNVVNIIPIKQFLPMYNILKDNYTAEEINAIFNKVKENYDVLLQKEETKKLELKK